MAHAAAQDCHSFCVSDLYGIWLLSSWFQDGCSTPSRYIPVLGTNKAKNQVLSPREPFYFCSEGLSSPGMYTDISLIKCVTGLSLSNSKGGWLESKANYWLSHLSF